MIERMKKMSNTWERLELQKIIEAKKKTKNKKQKTKNKKQKTKNKKHKTKNKKQNI